jgi:hypothetical protein
LEASFSVSIPHPSKLIPVTDDDERSFPVVTGERHHVLVFQIGLVFIIFDEDHERHVGKLRSQAVLLLVHPRRERRQQATVGAGSRGASVFRRNGPGFNGCGGDVGGRALALSAVLKPTLDGEGIRTLRAGGLAVRALLEPALHWSWLMYFGSVVLGIWELGDAFEPAGL